MQHNLSMGLGVKHIPSQQQQKVTVTSGKQAQDIGITKKYYSVISFCWVAFVDAITIFT